MYESFFNFRRKPFELLPNPEFLYPSRSHKKVLAYLNYGILERSGFILLTGEVGTGKTTLIRELIQKHLRDVLLIRVFHTKVGSQQLLAMINADLGLETTGKDKATLLRELHDYLVDQYAKRRPVVLIIDEAQNLTAEVLEEVRMLSNLETESDKLLHIILVGQPELRRILAVPELLQLRQRIQTICNIEPIGPGEIEEYIRFRLEAAGNREAIDMTADCFSAIHHYTRGIPRLINILCDYILLDAYANENRTVTYDTVEEIAKDLSFHANYWESTNQTVSDRTVSDSEDQIVNRGHSRGMRSKLYNLLLHLNRRLRELEKAQTGRSMDNDLHHVLQTMNQRMEDLWLAVESLKTTGMARPVAPSDSTLPDEPTCTAETSLEEGHEPSGKDEPDSPAPEIICLPAPVESPDPPPSSEDAPDCGGKISIQELKAFPEEPSAEKPVPWLKRFLFG